MDEQKKEDEKQTPAHLPERDINRVPEKKSVFIMVLLSAITLGIYPALWYMKKSQEFDNLGTTKRLNKKLPAALLIVDVILLALVIIFPLTITIDMGNFYQHMTPLQQMILAIIAIAAVLQILFCLILSIKSRTVINQALENKNSVVKISVLFSIIFNYLYLQYEINRILDDKENEKRIGPWVFLILIIISIASSFFSPFI